MTDAPKGTWRYNLLFGVLVLAAVGLCVRMTLLIRTGQEDAIARARHQQRMVVPLPGRPGMIFAETRGSYVPLAASHQEPSCYIDPFILRDQEIADVSIALGDALGLDQAGILNLQNKILIRKNTRFMWVEEARRMEPAAAEKVNKVIKKLDNSAIGITYEWQREYPNRTLAGALVGFRLRDGQGGGGLELAMDKRLSAVDGERVMLADAGRRPIWPLAAESRPPSDGSNVFLTIDTLIQESLDSAVNEAAEKYGAKWATGVVMDPQTGDVLAMSSTPGFDPSQFSTTSADNRTNRAICLPYEPGSALKPIYAAAAVDAGVVNLRTVLFCENGIYHAIKGGQISDHGSHYGDLTVEDIVVHSSNIGMAKIGEKLGNARLFEIARRFGFDATTGIELPGESAGILRPLNKWDGYSLRRVPFGQEISVTALQLANAFCALSNGGVLMKPRLVSHIVRPDGEVVWHSEPQVIRRVLKPSTATQMLAVLEQVVERGTGKACKLGRWTCGGKTGTAQIAWKGGYPEGAFTGSFIGIAPVSRPRVVCLISVYWPDKKKGHFGATIAAPYVKKVLEFSLTHLDVAPDKEPPAGPRATRIVSAAGRD
jgi:cell division protein FtsI/penicillin-binding protein 2